MRRLYSSCDWLACGHLMVATTKRSPTMRLLNNQLSKLSFMLSKLSEKQGTLAWRRSF